MQHMNMYMCTTHARVSENRMCEVGAALGLLEVKVRIEKSVSALNSPQR